VDEDMKTIEQDLKIQ